MCLSRFLFGIEGFEFGFDICTDEDVVATVNDVVVKL
jgi:hypothetical protein